MVKVRVRVRMFVAVLFVRYILVNLFSYRCW